MPDHVVQRLSYHSNWLGVKECTGNQRIQSYSDQGIMCWSGNDDEAHDSRHHHGGQVGLITLRGGGATCTRAIACKDQKCVGDGAMYGNTFEPDRRHLLHLHFMLYFHLASGIAPQQGCGLHSYRLCTLPLCLFMHVISCIW